VTTEVEQGDGGPVVKHGSWPGTQWKLGIGFALADAIVRRTAEKAHEINSPSVVVIVDKSGVDKFMARMDGAGLASVEVARNKAYTALSTGMSTHEIFGVTQAVPELGYGLPSVPRMCAIAGGLPITMGGRAVRAIGVSGGTLDQDLMIARYAVEELAASG
jgi:uncharacterized protein GlcG (DUF336 family)